MLIKVFLAGFLFSAVFIPIWDNLLDLIIMGMQVLKSYLAVVANKNQMKIEDMTDPPQKTNQIGFLINSDGEEDNEDDL